MGLFPASGIAAASGVPAVNDVRLVRGMIGAGSGTTEAAQVRATTGASRLGVASATVRPRIVLSIKTGPPTSTVTVSGRGFGAFRAVDIYFDTTDKALASTNAKGVFSGIPVRIPASAVPGEHYVTAVQRHSGRSAQASFLVNTNWARFRYSNTHTGFNPYENVLSRSNVAGLSLEWSRSLNGAFFSSPTVGNGVVYAGGLYALNASTGSQRWTSGIACQFSSAAVANGVVYFGSNDHNVYALKASTGAKLWSFKTAGSIFSSPAVANGVVYVGSNDGNVYALNASTGGELWRFTTGGGISSSPAVANGVVYIGGGNNSVYALNAATGAELWSFPAGGIINSSPAVANGVVYVGSNDGNVYALNASTGGELWRFTTSYVVGISPAVANGVVNAGSEDGRVYSFDLPGGVPAINRPTSAQLHPNHTLRPQKGKRS